MMNDQGVVLMTPRTDAYLDSLIETQLSAQTIYKVDPRETNGERVTYGTISNQCVTNMIKILNIGDKDIVYDLGSGVGNLIFKMLFSAGIRKGIGFEVIKDRYNVSNNIKKQIIMNYPEFHGKIEFYNANFKTILDSNRFADATIIYTSSLMFTDETMNLIVEIAKRCRNLRYLISLKANIHPNLEFHSRQSCACSWGRCCYYIYTLKHRVEGPACPRSLLLLLLLLLLACLLLVPLSLTVP